MKHPIRKELYFFVIIIFLCLAATNPKSLKQSEILKVSREDSILLVRSWKTFLDAINKRDKKEIMELSLEKISRITFGYTLPGLSQSRETMPVAMFIDSVVEKFYDRRFLSVLSDSAIHLLKLKYDQKDKPGIIYSVMFKEIVIGRSGHRYGNYYAFEFIKRKDKFIFYGIDLNSARDIILQ
jgi:hypothetical protein